MPLEDLFPGLNFAPMRQLEINIGLKHYSPYTQPIIQSTYNLCNSWTIDWEKLRKLAIRIYRDDQEGWKEEKGFDDDEDLEQDPVEAEQVVQVLAPFRDFVRGV